MNLADKIVYYAAMYQKYVEQGKVYPAKRMGHLLKEAIAKNEKHLAQPKLKFEPCTQ